MDRAGLEDRLAATLPGLRPGTRLIISAPNGGYVQVAVEGDGVDAEVASNDAVGDDLLADAAVADLARRGWEPPGAHCVNHHRALVGVPSAADVRALARDLADALVHGFGAAPETLVHRAWREPQRPGLFRRGGDPGEDPLPLPSLGLPAETLEG